MAKEGLAPKIIKERLDGMYGQSIPLYVVVKDRAKRFRIGKESLEDDASNNWSTSGCDIERHYYHCGALSDAIFKGQINLTND